MKKLSGLLVSLGLILAGVSSAGAEELNVFAAASLSDVMREIAADFSQASGVKISLNLAGTSTLKMQIEKGADCDVFISADSKSAQQLIDNNFVSPSGSTVLLTNRLVVVAPSNKPALSALSDLTMVQGFISLADPQTVPAGIYARESLVTAGIWDKVKDHIAPALDVRAALAQVEQGNADYGIVYKTDAQIAKKVKIVYEIPATYHSPIQYAACWLKQSKNPATAQKFIQFLKNEEINAIFKRYGFQLP